MKKGMTLKTLGIAMGFMMIAYGVAMAGFTNEYLLGFAYEIGEELDLLHVEQMANITYARIYLDNLRDGIRRDISVEELLNKIIENGVEKEKLNNYNIKIIDKDIYVTFKGEQ